MNREAGYYWVKYNWKGYEGGAEWCIAEWCLSKFDKREFYWHMDGFSTQDEKLFEEINEERIKAPGEKWEIPFNAIANTMAQLVAGRNHFSYDADTCTINVGRPAKREITVTAVDKDIMNDLSTMARDSIDSDGCFSGSEFVEMVEKEFVVVRKCEAKYI